MTDATNPIEHSSASAGQPQGGGEPDALDLIFGQQKLAVPVTNIDLTSLGDCTITIGASGEIVSIVKAGAPSVAMLSAADSHLEN